ncbi:hypothetical protein RHSIM_Rhsim10G0115700 [Rhododendron simsii]|uniref:Uncoupling protein 3 n=1 Tax=Rhododendron simsii TaxID=118357 RepID=A0A834G967_RHOSS|nr:hypothetical protein RHSIM_Rhsim10G0115700 [Rhododendron simsii]
MNCEHRPKSDTEQSKTMKGKEDDVDKAARTKILLTSLSAMVAETTTFPIDIMKTRLQLHGDDSHSSSSSSSRRPASAFRIATNIVRREGPLGLYKGLTPAIIRHLFYTPIRIVIASPADLIKVRLQADGRTIRQGLQPRYSGPFDALNKILQKEGIVGLWKGVFPNVQRAFLVNMGELACYDHAKRLIIQNQIAGDNVYAHTLASIMSSLSATALSCPADVVKTRVMNHTVSNEGKVKYRNSFHCLVKTVRVEGLGALWKGFFPTWARLGPWQFVFWVSYEKFRQAAGLSSF